MFAQYQKRGIFPVLLILLTSVAYVLSACRGNPSIKGKWEQTSGVWVFLGPGTFWEFFDDGTVSIADVAGKYSWPDNSHLKIEFQGQVSNVYEFARSGDEITLRDSYTQEVITLKRYKELFPSPESLAGTWKKERMLDESQCFLALGIYAPDYITFGADRTFSVQQEASFLSEGVSLYGQFSVSGNSLRISATGTKTSDGTNQKQIGGELNCQVTVSHSRLLFKDDRGRVTLYVRVRK